MSCVTDFFMAEVLYLINVHTGTLPASGTDADVFITVFGDGGDSCKRRLERSHFERGQVSTDSFSLRLFDVFNFFIF